MKIAAGVALGLVLGFLLGGIGPRRNLAAAEKKIARLESEAASAASPGGFGLPGLDEMFRPSPAATPPVVAVFPVQDAGTTAVVAENVAPAVVAPTPEPSSPKENPPPSRDFAQAIAMARDAQDLRRAQALSALVDTADLSTEEQAQLTTQLDKMNRDLAGYTDEVMSMWRSRQRGRDEVPALEALSLAHEVSGVLAESQGTLERIVGERRGDVPRESLQIWNFVDLGPMAQMAATASAAPTGDLP